MRENLFRTIEDFLWQTGQARDLDSITFVRAARDYLAEENNLLVPFADGDIEIADAFAFYRELRQLVVMRCEQCSRFDLVMEKFGDAPGDRQTIERRCPAADLIENHEAALGGIVNDVRGLVHLHHERGLPAREIVVRAHARENAIYQTDLCAHRRHEAPDLRHQNNQRNLADIGRFPRHVRPGHDRQPYAVAVERRIVRNKFFFDEVLIEHWMAAVFDHQAQRIV